jgi:hypothetical protein
VFEINDEVVVQIYQRLPLDAVWIVNYVRQRDCKLMPQPVVPNKRRRQANILDHFQCCGLLLSSKNPAKCNEHYSGSVGKK